MYLSYVPISITKCILPNPPSSQQSVRAPVLLVIPAWMEAIGTCAHHPIYSAAPVYFSVILLYFSVFL